jgi:hypothetical protein
VIAQSTELGARALARARIYLQQCRHLGNRQGFGQYPADLDGLNSVRGIDLDYAVNQQKAKKVFECSHHAPHGAGLAIGQELLYKLAYVATLGGGELTPIEDLPQLL